MIHPTKLYQVFGVLLGACLIFAVSLSAESSPGEPISEEGSKTESLNQSEKLNAREAFGRVMLENLQTGEYRFLREHWKNGPVILNFWATYCVPCRSEIPELQSLVAEFEGWKLILITIDDSDSRQAVLEAMKSWGINATVLYDRYQQAARHYLPDLSVPATFLVKNGQIVFSVSGYSAKTMSELRDYLKRNPPSTPEMASDPVTGEK